MYCICTYIFFCKTTLQYLQMSIYDEEPTVVSVMPTPNTSS